MIIYQNNKDNNHARFLIFSMMKYVLLLKKIQFTPKTSGGTCIQNLSFSSIVYTNVTKNQCFIKNAQLGFFLIDSVGYTNELKHSCQTP